MKGPDSRDDVPLDTVYNIYSTKTFLQLFFHSQQQLSIQVYEPTHDVLVVVIAAFEGQQTIHVK